MNCDGDGMVVEVMARGLVGIKTMLKNIYEFLHHLINI